MCGKHYSTSSNLARHRCVGFFCEMMICWPKSMQFEYLANILEMAILWVLAEEFHFIMLIWFPRQTHRSPEDSKARKCPECNKVRKNRGISFSRFYLPGLRFDACLFHAPANPRLRPPLSPMWKDILSPVAVKRTHADPHGGETVRLSHLWKVFLWQVEP